MHSFTLEFLPMDAAVTPQILIIGSLIALLLVALVARHFEHRRNPRTSHGRYGDDHSQAITEMSQRTLAEAQRKEREQLARTTPNLGH
jgi:uncharacterized membrane protein YccC